MNILKNFLISILILILPLTAFSQNVKSSFGKGIGFTPADSSFSVKFSTRFQTLYLGVQNLDNDTYNDALLVRRARLKFEGFVYNPKVTYKIELGQSNRDTGGGNKAQFNNTSNMILDAVVKYRFSKGWTVWFGQTKLPGNRERVISSQKLQMVDRSLVNARYNLDRDIGIQFHHKGKIGNGVLKEAFAISMGEGRGIITQNIGGYSYTARIEYLPMGEFTNKGDYFGSDLEREPSGKLSIGATYDYNDGAGRSRGQLGDFMIDENGVQYTNDLQAILIDIMYKNNGFSLMSEYATKSAKDQIIVTTSDGSLRYSTGAGFMAMAGYLFRNNLELSGRFTNIESDDLVYSGVTNENEYTLGLSKYIVDHALKIQTDLSYSERELRSDRLIFRFQVEVSL